MPLNRPKQRKTSRAGVARRGGRRETDAGPLDPIAAHSIADHTEVGALLASRLRGIEERADSFAHMDRINLAVPMIADAVEKMRAAKLTEKEIASLFRFAADELGG